MKHKELLQELMKWTDRTCADSMPALPTFEGPVDHKTGRAEAKRIGEGVRDLSIAATIADNVLDEVSGGLQALCLLELDAKQAERGAQFTIEWAKSRLDRVAISMIADCASFASLAYHKHGADVNALRDALKDMGGDLGPWASGVLAMAHYAIEHATSQEHVARRFQMATRLMVAIIEKASQVAYSAAETPAIGTSADVNVFFNAVFFASGRMCAVGERIHESVSKLLDLAEVLHDAKEEATAQAKPTVH